MAADPKSVPSTPPGRKAKLAIDAKPSLSRLPMTT
jgi:hypothetical protein